MRGVEVTHRELRDIVWKQLRLRIASCTTAEDMHKVLAYETCPSQLPANQVNEIRDELIGFIEAHRDRLSLPCTGDCYTHSDGVVLSCYLQYKEDRSG